MHESPDVGPDVGEAGNRQYKLGGSMLTRGLALMNVYLSGEVELSQTELARRTNLPKPTVHRLVNMLVGQGALERTRTGVRLGPWIFLLGQSVPHFSLLRAAGQPCLDRLCEFTRAHTCLSVMVYGKVVDIASAGPTPWRPVSDHLNQQSVSAAASRALREADVTTEPVVATVSVGAEPARIPEPRADQDRPTELVSVAMMASVDSPSRAALSIVGPRGNVEPRREYPHLKAATAAFDRRLALLSLFGVD